MPLEPPTTDGAMTRSESVLFQDDADYEGYSSTPLPKTMEEQRQEITALRELKAQQQVARWQFEASGLNPRIKFITLLQEAYSYEVRNVRENAGPRPFSSLSDCQRLHLEMEVKESYRALLKEGRRLFFYRASRGATPQELQVVGSQALSSFAALYPWSDGITCRDLTEQHPNFMHLASRNQVQVGHSGVTTMCSFSAALACSSVKMQASLSSKQQRIGEYYAARSCDEDLEFDLARCGRQNSSVSSRGGTTDIHNKPSESLHAA